MLSTYPIILTVIHFFRELLWKLISDIYKSRFCRIVFLFAPDELTILLFLVKKSKTVSNENSEYRNVHIKAYEWSASFVIQIYKVASMCQFQEFKRIAQHWAKLSHDRYNLPFCDPVDFIQCKRCCLLSKLSIFELLFPRFREPGLWTTEHNFTFASFTFFSSSSTSSPIPVAKAENPRFFNCSTWSWITETNEETTLIVLFCELKAFAKRGYSWNIKLLPNPVGRIATHLYHAPSLQGTFSVPSLAILCAGNLLNTRSTWKLSWLHLFHASGRRTPSFWMTGLWQEQPALRVLI